MFGIFIIILECGPGLIKERWAWVWVQGEDVGLLGNIVGGGLVVVLG